MLHVSFYVMLAPRLVFLCTLHYMLSTFSVTYSRPPSMNARNRIPFFWDDAASVGSRILTFRSNLMSSQGVDMSLNNSRALRPITEEAILLVTKMTNKMQLCRIIYYSLTTCFERYYRLSSGASKL
jgi:hypothetical protein